MQIQPDDAPTASGGYRPDRCDLCGASGGVTVLDLRGRAMTSDSRIVAADLRKVQCSACGLIRSGEAFSADRLASWYGLDYRLAEAGRTGEPMIRDGEDMIPRSQALADWTADGWSRIGVGAPASVLEIGCGEGRVLKRLAARWPAARVQGIEPNASAVALGRREGLAIAAGNYRDAEGRHDLVFAVAVIEHVPSPVHFAAALARHVTPGGALLLIQPCQDGTSHDIFFIDHLHHFYGSHMARIGAAAGLCQAFQAGPNRLLPHFSLHGFAGSGAAPPAAAEPAPVAVPACIPLWLRRFDAVDRWLADTAARPLHVAGVGEVFTLLRAYTSLGAAEIRGGFDDNLARFESQPFPFPVTAVSDDFKGTNMRILFTFRPREALRARLKDASVPWYCPLDDNAMEGR